MTQPQTSEASETVALDVVYAWLGGGRAARQYLTETRYRHLVQHIALALDGQRADYERVADELKGHADDAYRERKLYPPGSADRTRYEYRGLALALAASRVRQVGQQQ